MSILFISKQLHHRLSVITNKATFRQHMFVLIALYKDVSKSLLFSFFFCDKRRIKICQVAFACVIIDAVNANTGITEKYLLLMGGRR